MAGTPASSKRGYSRTSPRWDDRTRTAQRHEEKLGGPSSPEEAALFKWLLDAENGASIFEFIEFFLVKTEKAGEYVQFVLRERQRDIVQLVLAAWERGEAAKLVVLKTRRYGISTLLLLLTLERVLRVPGWEGTTIAKDDVDAKYFLGKAREFANQVPAWALAAANLEKITASRNELAYRSGKFKESRIRVVTANTKGLGRGPTNNGLHPTEYPHWAKQAKGDYEAIQPTLGDFAGNWEINESTACGFEEFQQQFEEAHWPGEPARNSKFVRVFIGWHEHPNARETFEDEDEVAEFEKSLGKIAKFGREEELTLLGQTLLPYNDFDRRAALEQLRWRRITITDKCKKKGLDQFHQEYPTTPEEAFVSTGRPYFYLPQIRAWLPIARRQHQLAHTGEFVQKGDTVKWVAGENGKWRMLEDRIAGEVYCHGNDTASGRRVIADGSKEADYPVTYIGHVLSGRHVAELRAHVRPRHHAAEVAKATLYYGKAQGYTERAVTGDDGTMLSRLQDVCIGEFCGDDVCLRSVRFVFDLQGNRSAEEIIGIATKRDTKRQILEGLRDFIEEEVGEPAERLPAETDEQYWDRAAQTKPSSLTYNCLREALHFEEIQSDAGNLKFEAGKGHDDCVMAAAIMERARQVVIDDIDRAPKVEDAVPPLEAAELEMYEAMWACEPRAQDGHTQLGRGY